MKRRGSQLTGDWNGFNSPHVTDNWLSSQHWKGSLLAVKVGSTLHSSQFSHNALRTDHTGKHTIIKLEVLTSHWPVCPHRLHASLMLTGRQATAEQASGASGVLWPRVGGQGGGSLGPSQTVHLLPLSPSPSLSVSVSSGKSVHTIGTRWTEGGPGAQSHSKSSASISATRDTQSTTGEKK